MKVSFEIQEFTLFDGWINTWSDENGKPSQFKTEVEAWDELDGFLSDMQRAVNRGDMEDMPSRDDYRIVCVLNREMAL